MGWLVNLFTGGVFSALGTFITGILTPYLNYKTETANVALDGFKTAAGVDEAGYEAYLKYEASVMAARAAEASWWGPKLLLMIVGVPACLHVALISLDSTFTFWTGHYGALGIAKLPPDYFAYEKVVIDFVFGVSVIGPPASAVAAWLHRKA